MSNHKVTVYPKNICSLLVSCHAQVTLVIFVYKNVSVNYFNGVLITA
jgi:hypothetical protein